MCEIRIVLCEVCGSEGRDLRSNGGQDDIDYGECKHCRGKGTVIIETQPIGADDLDAAAGMPTGTSVRP